MASETASPVMSRPKMSSRTGGGEAGVEVEGYCRRGDAGGVSRSIMGMGEGGGLGRLGMLGRVGRLGRRRRARCGRRTATTLSRRRRSHAASDLSRSCFPSLDRPRRPEVGDPTGGVQGSEGGLPPADELAQAEVSESRGGAEG